MAPMRNSCGDSPLADIDPLVRALHTFMFGILVHFGTLWMYGIYTLPTHGDMNDANICLENDSINNHQDSSSSLSCTRLWTLILLHEYWVYLQHCNVLANPYCQRLDRQYGIALLKSNQHWAIAGTYSFFAADLGIHLVAPQLFP
jgi:hypothetical protein